MKVKSSNNKDITLKPKKKLNKADIEAKLKAKFGDKVAPKKSKPVADKTELSSKKGVSSSNDDEFGDLGTNDPSSEATQEKLKDILKTGAFAFNEKERKTLSSILM